MICLLFAGVAFGQSYLPPSTLSSSVQVVTHQMRAAQQPMAQDQDLRESSNEMSAHGERPLWEAMPLPQAPPLGDIARELKKQRDEAPKALKTWEN